MHKSLAHYVPNQQISIRIQRSKESLIFSETELHILDLANEHLNNLYAGLGRKSQSSDRLSKEDIVQRFSNLSPREAEICSFVASRYSTAEIASSLLIGCRTVEKHLESIFDKLDVRPREQLRWRLGVAPLVGISNALAIASLRNTQ
jgi:DNA-binding NarL/FixJ family response regulator